MIKYLFCILNVLFFIEFTSAQAGAEDYSQLLTGKSKKEWTITSWVRFMGAPSSPSCDQGKSYVFRADGHLDILHCENGKEITDKSTWAMAKVANETILTIGSAKYKMLVKHSRGADEIRLRSLTSSKTEPETVITLKYEKD